MKVEKTILIKIIFIIIFFIVTFISEFFYRKPLFNNSVEIAKALQNSLSSVIKLFDYFTVIGKIDYILIGIVLFFFPISYSYTFFLTVVLSWHFGGLTKLIYGESRPHYLDSSVGKSGAMAATGYGNPSGHSFRSSCNYLSLVQLIIDIFELQNIIKIIIYVLVAIIVLLINFSRVILGAHSINQVIYGDTLGFTEYFIIFQIIKPHLRKPDVFFERFLNKKYHLINLIILLIVTLYSSITSVICQKNRNDKNNLKNIASAIDTSLSFTSYFGMIYGMTALAYIIKKKYYSNYNYANNYYQNLKTKWYFFYGMRLLLLIVCFIPYNTHFLKGAKINQVYIDIFGYALPMFIYGYLPFGFYYVMIIISNISNKDIYIPHIEDKFNFLDYNINKDEEILESD